MTPSLVCSRTVDVKNAIVAAVTGKSTCGTITTADLAGITSLNVGDTLNTSLKPGDFDDLTGLTRLVIQDFPITSLPAGIFDDLTALTTLEVYATGLAFFPAGVFDKLTGLTKLNLANNGLLMTRLPTRIFAKLTSLETLYLNGNLNLTCLPYIPASVTDLRLGPKRPLPSLWAACDAGVTVSKTSIKVAEGWVARYTMVLDAYPVGNVQVQLASSSEDTAIVPKGTFTFTQSNWNTPQQVTVTGVAAGSATVTHAAVGGGYGGVIAANVNVTVVPDKALILSATNVTVPESSTAAYTVALDTLPTADVTVTVASDDTGAVTVEPGTLTFTPGNYSSAQTVTVTGVVDADDADERVALSHEAVGGDYSAFEIVTVVVNDRSGLTFRDQAISDQTYVNQTAIAALTLPAAQGNKGSVRYAITPALPAGLTFDPATRVLADTPTEPQAATRYAYTATDEDGDPATASFTITVHSAAEKALLEAGWQPRAGRCCPGSRG